MKRVLRIAIATPAPAGTTRGNRLTATRYARLLRSLGHSVRVVDRWRRGDEDVLIALHAAKSHASIAAFARAHPGRPIVLVLTGTDVYGGLDARARESLRRATRIVTLQPEALRELDARSRAKAESILQSGESAPRARSKPSRGITVVALGHLRAVKQPFLLAEAIDLLPESSRVAAVHAGAALDAAHRRRARSLTSRSSRWRWLGAQSHARALRLLERADAFVQTSISEGGSLALVEALVRGVPVLVTRIPAAIGMLGRRHPGYFPAGDAAALARLLLRFERDASFRRRLARESRRLARAYTPAAERARWRALLARL